MQLSTEKRINSSNTKYFVFLQIKFHPSDTKFIHWRCLKFLWCEARWIITENKKTYYFVPKLNLFWIYLQSVWMELFSNLQYCSWLQLPCNYNSFESIRHLKYHSLCKILLIQHLLVVNFHALIRICIFRL